jgi:hypothetical protein
VERRHVVHGERQGIADSGGPDTVINGGRIQADATALTGSATVAVAVSGVAIAIGTATANANASALELGDGSMQTRS